MSDGVSLIFAVYDIIVIFCSVFALAVLMSVGDVLSRF